jgi:orotidine-5'-phosphate decarboxylase
MKKDVIIACDFPSAEACLEFLDLFKDRPRKPFVKIGMELFYAAGPDIVRQIKARGHKIFLDLKLHDIPNTVERAFRVLANLDVDMVNCHAGGGKIMMEAALRGLSQDQRGTEAKRPLLIAVTQLTSTDDKTLHEDLLIPEEMEDVVKHYALNARDAGLDGVVCSPWEAAGVHQYAGEKFLTVTPGIRFESQAGKDDQKRIMTPAKAREAGSDFIVVGRPITRVENPVQAYEKCLADFLGE